MLPRRLSPLHRREGVTERRGRNLLRTAPTSMAPTPLSPRQLLFSYTARVLEGLLTLVSQTHTDYMNLEPHHAAGRKSERERTVAAEPPLQKGAAHLKW